MRTVKKIVKFVSLLLLMAFTFAVGNIVSAKIISGLDKKYIFEKPENRYGIVASDGSMSDFGAMFYGYIGQKHNNLEWRYILTRRLLNGNANYYTAIWMDFFSPISDFETKYEFLWYAIVHAEQLEELSGFSSSGRKFEDLSCKYLDNHHMNALDSLAYIVYHEGALQGDSECLEKMEEYKAKKWNLDLSK